MKILMINVVCGIRSTGRICTDLAMALEKAGHEVRIAYGRECVPEQYKKKAVRIGTQFEVRLHGIRARLFDGCGWGSKNATEQFLSWVKTYDPDVIHLHNLHGYYINIESLFNYLRICRKRIIWTLHDCWAFTGHSAYCDAISCERWMAGCGNCPQISLYPKSYFDRSDYNWKRKKVLMTGIPNIVIVTPSEWLAQKVNKSFLSDYPVVTIHNGIDTKQFSPTEGNWREKLSIENKIMLLGVATAWDDMKGYSDYLKLANRLGEEYRIVLVGLTKEQIRRLPGNVIGLERTNNTNELAQLYTAADLFLNLSYCENYPTVNLEAISCGTPVLTYNTGGSAESAGASAIIVNRGDIDSVVHEVLSFKKIQPDFDKRDIDYRETVKKYLELFEQ